ncbi:hypothetical protein SUGI_0463890 [Cryptomeria japonica]|nr:hypothetical protein SUGI_0463890 [Cryptomeria japonica]
MLQGHPPLLSLLDESRQYVVRMLGRHVSKVFRTSSLNWENMPKQWDAYKSENFSPTVEFGTNVLEIYMYLILQSYQATQTMDSLVDKLEELKESLRVAKFCIEYLLLLGELSKLQAEQAVSEQFTLGALPIFVSTRVQS